MSEDKTPLDDKVIKIPEVRPGMPEGEMPDPLDDTAPRPAIVLDRLDWRVGLAAVGLGILCALAGIAWVLKSALDAIE